MNKNQIRILLFILLIATTRAFPQESKQNNGGNIIIENKEMRLLIGRNGYVKSLIHKPTGQECLKTDSNVPAFTLTQNRPYDNELQLAHPAKSKTFAADTIFWENGDLIVGFEPEKNRATIGIKITDAYIGFKLKEFNYVYEGYRERRKTEVDEFTLLQLPVTNRDYFGEWLNVSWDSDVAVNLLATDPYAKIDAEEREGYRIFTAGTVTEVKPEDVGAALIVTSKDNLFNCIEQVESDYGLPEGVKSRRGKEYGYSYYEVWDAAPENIDQHIAFAKKGGFKAIQIVWTSFASTIGTFNWNNKYPNEIKDLQTVIGKIKAAGMIAGAHIWYNKAEKNDPYVSPLPDYRLNLRRNFTLAKSLDRNSETVVVEETPEGCTMENGRRILKVENELIEYIGYTTTRPYRFTGCKRGILKTEPSEYNQGLRFGLLDVDTWVKWVRFDQRTSIQQEVAGRIGDIYNEAGFDFLYFDGAEDVHPPWWFYTSLSQLTVYNALQPAPAFAEGALKSHFSWHILTRGNAFDVFRPEIIKDAVREHPLAEAELVALDFTSINFGWVGYALPGKSTTGMQPDMFEYVWSRAAAWDCPASLVGSLDQLSAHPRTSDNLEVIRRWEKARLSGFFSDEQKLSLQNPHQEHILLLDEKGNFELQPYEQIQGVAGGKPDIRAFIYERKKKTCVVYWHTSSEGNIELNLSSDHIRLYKQPGKEIQPVKTAQGIILPASDRFYLETDLERDQVIEAFKKAKIL